MLFFRERPQQPDRAPEPPAPVIPSSSASLCLDCASIYDGARTRSCPACASEASVGVEEFLTARTRGLAA